MHPKNWLIHRAFYCWDFFTVNWMIEHSIIIYYCENRIYELWMGHTSEQFFVRELNGAARTIRYAFRNGVFVARIWTILVLLCRSQQAHNDVPHFSKRIWRLMQNVMSWGSQSETSYSFGRTHKGLRFANAQSDAHLSCEAAENLELGVVDDRPLDAQIRRGDHGFVGAAL